MRRIEAEAAEQQLTVGAVNCDADAAGQHARSLLRRIRALNDWIHKVCRRKFERNSGLKRQRERNALVLAPQQDMIIELTVARPPRPTLPPAHRQHVPLQAPRRQQLATNFFKEFVGFPHVWGQQLGEGEALLRQLCIRETVAFGFQENKRR